MRENTNERFSIFRNQELKTEVEEASESVSYPTATADQSSFSAYFGYNIVDKVRMDWGAMEQYLLTMQLNEATRGLVQEMVDANPCVNSLQAYNSMMEGGAKLLIDNASLIEDMLVSLLSLR